MSTNRILDIGRARRLVEWSKPWNKLEAKRPDPQEPSRGRLVVELGEQLEAALEVLHNLLPGGLES